MTGSDLEPPRKGSLAWARFHADWLGRLALKGLAGLALAAFALYSCAEHIGLRSERSTEFGSCQDADAAAAESQRASVAAERDGDDDKVERELRYQSQVIVANEECFPIDVIVDARDHLDRVGAR